MSSSRFASWALVAACWAAVALPSQAAVVTAVPGDIDVRVVTFAPYDTVLTPTVITGIVDVGTAEVGEAVNLSFNPDGELRALGAVATDLGANGQWPGSGAYAGLLAASGEMDFRFARGMNFVGGFFNFDPDAFDGNLTLTAYGAGDVFLEELLLDFRFANPAGVGLGEFHGFARPAADIFRITLSNSEAVVDNLSFGTARATPVPTPATWALLLTALLALAWVVRRRRGQAGRRSGTSRSASRT